MMGSCGAMDRGGAMTICCGAITGHVGREGHMERVHLRLDQSYCVWRSGGLSLHSCSSGGGRPGC